jgi:hypothetical protein
MRRAAWLALAAAACGPVDAASSAPTPANACPDHPCDAYVQPGAPPICEQGACIVNAMPSAVLVVALPGDSYFAPGRTFAVAFPPPSLPCPPSTCAQLPDVAVVRAQYSVTPQVQQMSLQYSLNPQHGKTSLPVHVTYRPLWPPTSLSEADDAIAAGLPLEPVEIESVVNESGDVPGPAGSPSQMFVSYMQPGNYLRSITPRPPLDAICPPEVRVVSVKAGTQFADNSMNVDPTLEMGSGNSTIPVFTVTLVDPDATLGGWTAFLRDQTTGQVLSNGVTLGSTNSVTFNLLTNHFPVGGDALNNAELVEQPPAGQAIPTGVFAPVANVLLPQNEPYSAMPPPQVVRGFVSAADGTPVEADVIFESTAIYASQTPVTAGVTPMPAYVLQTANYFYAAHAYARKDESGAAGYFVQLPPGLYRVSVRPSEPLAMSVTGPQAVPPYAVTMGPVLEVPFDKTPAPVTTVFVASPTQAVPGSALVSDGRPLAGAAVDAIPAACADGSTAHSCLPRARETITQADGTFVLWLDPGAYRMRVRPADGTRLPWMWLPQPVVVGPTMPSLPQFVVPAPIYAGLTLKDPQGNPIVRAIVRVFEAPDAATGWAEMGRAITDVSGHYDMYLAPPKS